MSKILFFVATLLVASIAAESTSSTTAGPSTSTTDAAHQKPAIISDSQKPSHVQKREDSQAKPPVIAVTAGTPDHQNNTSHDAHSVQKREDSEVKPAVISVEAGAPNHPSNDTHSVIKREDSPVKPPVVHDLTFSTLKPTGGVSASTQRPSDSPQNGIACVQNYEPVCGSDGKVYSNICVLGLATQKDPAIVLAKKGEC